MRLKDDSVKVAGMRTELLLAAFIADQVYSDMGLDFVITSVTDGKHSATSLHYVGAAFDCRIYDQTPNEKIVKEIKRRLNIDYDVVLEGNHIHVEFQPRYR